MKILSADVNWYEGWSNEPELKMVVDKMPPSEEFIYAKHDFGDDRALYFAKHECGLVRFFSHDRRNERGYAGAEFILNMDDGSKEAIKGPWSSRSGVMNRYFHHSVECVVKERDGDFPNLGMACHMTIELAHEVARMAGVTLALRPQRNERDSDIAYSIVEEKPNG